MPGVKLASAGGTTIMNEAAQRADPAQCDRTWVGYHPRAMMPAIALATIASLALWSGRWFLDDISELADHVGALALFAMAWAVWPVLIAIFLYRTITYTYRLTDRAMLVEFGFLARPVPALRLIDVTTVTSGEGWLARRLEVGWVEVRTHDRAIRLPGVRNPTNFAIAIREAMERTRSAARPPG